MPFFRNWILNNWHLKLFALLAAFLLWSTYTSEPAAEVAYVVPIEFRNVPRHLELSGDAPAQVRLRVRGRSALLRRLSAADLGVSVDLAGAQPGEMLVRLTPDMVETPYGAVVVRIAPAEIRLTFAAGN
ncbi:MAG: CdaR family protein [Acidobacteria bacterium]|nr:CdaR family protein [Acidobacteriota bacterium]MCL5289091.1 CdaR family protein [Acidobacteriota bacterium]